MLLPPDIQTYLRWRSICRFHPNQFSITFREIEREYIEARQGKIFAYNLGRYTAILEADSAPQLGVSLASRDCNNDMISIILRSIRSELLIVFLYHVTVRAYLAALWCFLEWVLGASLEARYWLRLCLTVYSTSKEECASGTCLPANMKHSYSLEIRRNRNKRHEKMHTFFHRTHLRCSLECLLSRRWRGTGRLDLVLACSLGLGVESSFWRMQVISWDDCFNKTQW